MGSAKIDAIRMKVRVNKLNFDLNIVMIICFFKNKMFVYFLLLGVTLSYIKSREDCIMKFLANIMDL